MTETLLPTATSSVARVHRAFDRLAEVDRPEVWITLRDRGSVLADAERIDARVAAGELLPLAGWLLAVKDNIDVAGLPTTAACPEFAYRPSVSATAVQRLTDAGALVLGKTNLDQFATGLVGSRSPYGAVRAAHHPAKVSGGSSSGSAVAVALGIVDIALGTDTAGSGRVPAAFNGIVGLKPTLGVVPLAGVVPACADYDCVTVFGTELATAATALAVMSGFDDSDPFSRRFPADAPMGAPLKPRVAVPAAANLHALCREYSVAFESAVRQLIATGVEVRAVDVEPLLDAAKLLYDGSIVAQRYAAVGAFLETQPAGADPTVSRIVLGARGISGHEVVRDTQALLAAKRTAEKLLAGFDALFLPTTTEQPALAAVAAEPLAINRRLGTFTNFCNLLDMAAMAVPAGFTTDGEPFGAMFVVPAFADQVAIDLAARFLGTAAGPPVVTGGVPLAVFGAHLRGQPLNFQLVSRGARFESEIQTSDDYRLVALDTVPAKPGLVHVDAAGAPIAGELWTISAAGLGTLLAELPAPMSLTSVELADGRAVVGFGCAHDAAESGEDITEFGGWLAYQSRRTGAD